tara:strand:- start:772 stop:1059 length:288 start_codon:yes stop_codon:yes gene_type:complete
MEQVLEILLIILIVAGILLAGLVIWVFLSLYRKISKILDLASKTSKNAEELSGTLLSSVKNPGDKSSGWVDGTARVIKFFTGFHYFRKKGDQTDE